MVAACEPLALGQELVQMATPARRVLAVAQPLRLGGIKYALDPAAKTGGGFRLLVPKRLEAESTSSVVILSTGRRRSGAA